MFPFSELGGITTTLECQKQSFPKILKGLRKQKKLSLEGLANALGMSKGTIYRYESGKRKPDFQAMTKLERFFGVSGSYLRGETDEINCPVNHQAADPQEPDKLFEVTDEFITDLAYFTNSYVSEVRAAIVQNARHIFEDATLVYLLHEYRERAEQEFIQYKRSVADTVRHCFTFNPSNNCLTHAGSYRDVIEDLLRPYWV